MSQKKNGIDWEPLYSLCASKELGSWLEQKKTGIAVSSCCENIDYMKEVGELHLCNRKVSSSQRQQVRSND